MNNDTNVHSMRLESDYQSMQRLRGSIISWQASSTSNPAQRIYPSKYYVSYNILAPTVKGVSRQHIIEIDCSSLDYPRNIPHARFLTPVVKHPHFFDDGVICLGGFPLEESLSALCVRLGEFLQYNPALINPDSIASEDFHRWYRSNRNHLPLEHVRLPEIEDEDASSGIKIKQRRDGYSGTGEFTVKRRTTRDDQSW